jgi:hypothetical protein
MTSPYIAMALATERRDRLMAEVAPFRRGRRVVVPRRKGLGGSRRQRWRLAWNVLAPLWR